MITRPTGLYLLSSRREEQAGLLTREVLAQKLDAIGIPVTHWDIENGIVHRRWALRDWEIAPFDEMVDLPFQDLGKLVTDRTETILEEERARIAHALWRGISSSKPDVQRAAFLDIAHACGLPDDPMSLEVLGHR